MFKVLPDAEIEWRHVRVGALVTALLFVLGKYLVGLYLGNSSVLTPYGAAGSLALILVWTYYSSMIVLIGAEFTQVWAQHRQPAVPPEPGAVRVIREEKPVSR
jgi:membrane protein